MIWRGHEYINKTNKKSQAGKWGAGGEKSDIKEQTGQINQSQHSDDQTMRWRRGEEKSEDRGKRKHSNARGVSEKGRKNSLSQSSCSILTVTMAADWVGQGSQTWILGGQSYRVAPLYYRTGWMLRFCRGDHLLTLKCLAAPLKHGVSRTTGQQQHVLSYC